MRCRDRLGVLATLEQTKDREQDQAWQWLWQHNQLLTMIARGTDLDTVLDAVNESVESLCSGAICSVMVLDDNGVTLSHVAGALLPAAYVGLIDGLSIGPTAGSFASAAFYKRLMTVSDIAKDPLWAAYCQPALASGLQSCWSYPIIAQDGSALGTLNIYTRQVGEPTSQQLALMKSFASITGIALEGERRNRSIDPLADYDRLTNLPTRTVLQQRLYDKLKQMNGSGALAVLILDIDHFRVLNDSLNHCVGDEILVLVANRLQYYFNDQAFVARMSGDEFVVVWTGAHEQLLERIDRFMSSFAQAQWIQGRTVHISLSGGIAEYTHQGEAAYDLLKRADLAMYSAKTRGRNLILRYTAEMTNQIVHRRQLEEQMQRALYQNEFSLVYQPKEHMGCNSITGVEALLRWHHPELGLISPVEFIPVAEVCGLIVPIGDWVLETACVQLRDWDLAGLAQLHVAVNVSARQFAMPDFLAKLKNLLTRYAVNPERLQLEMTETAMMERSVDMQATLGQLRELGVQVAIDDFGVAYSSLGYLQQFPLDTLKIDQSFISGIVSDRHALVTAIIALGHSLNLKVVAEGVETQEQKQFLSEQACDEIQGYLLARPMTAAQLVEYLAERARTKPAFCTCTRLHNLAIDPTVQCRPTIKPRKRS